MWIFPSEKSKVYVKRSNDYLNVGNVKFEMSAKEGGCLSGSWEFGQETGEIGYIGVVVLHVP